MKLPHALESVLEQLSDECIDLSPLSTAIFLADEEWEDLLGRFGETESHLTCSINLENGIVLHVHGQSDAESLDGRIRESLRDIRARLRWLAEALARAPESPAGGAA